MTKPNDSTRPAAELIALAVSHHQTGRLGEAETLYRQALANDPSDAQVLRLLGLVAAQTGRLTMAREMIGRALALRPGYADAHHSLGTVLAAENKQEEAAAHFQQAVSLQPHLVDAQFCLGLVRMRQGQSAAAATCFERVVKLQPSHPEAHYNLGYILQNQGRLHEAAAMYRRAIEINPGFAEAMNSLGSVLLAGGERAEAAACFERCLALQPSLAQAHCNLGIVLLEEGKLTEAADRFKHVMALAPEMAETHYNLATVFSRQGHHQDARIALEQALALRPHFVEALNSLGLVLRDLRLPAEALKSFDKVLSIKPDYADALNNRGLALRDLGQIAEALKSFDAALQIRPADPAALHNRGLALHDVGYADEALASFDKSLAVKLGEADVLFSRGLVLRELKRPTEARASFERTLAVRPDHPYAFGALADAALAACDWQRTAILIDELQLRVEEERGVIPPLTLLSCCDDERLHLQCARHRIADKVPAMPVPLQTRPAHDDKRIKLAYLSADFREHAVASLIAGLIERHERDRFEVIGISLGPDDESEMRARLARSFDAFYDVRSMSDLEVAKLLNDLHVDIAIDLNGHTQHSRPVILAHRPAPIQVTYLGYPGTVGADFIDYLIADEIVVPRERQPFYTEKIAYLPDCYQVNDNKRKIADTRPRRGEVGLPANGFVFCCFNNNHKINAPLFDIWMRLLHQTEGSVLWLLQDSSDAADNLRKEAATRGIEPNRLIFAPRLRPEMHLARQCLADLFLDTLPYNAHVTASDALWVGLPVVTCRGNAFAGRVGASLLQAAGLSELVTRTLEEYEMLALRLATDPSLLQGFRLRLQQNLSSCALFDTEGFCRRIESAYVAMWSRHRLGYPPQSFSVERNGEVNEPL